MLTKAILTGGVLSVLAGTIVYFGTEGAGALDKEASSTNWSEETELAGGIETKVELKSGADEAGSEVQKVAGVSSDAAHPHLDAEKPKKPKARWLDEYLKKEKADEAASDVVEATDEASSDVPVVTEVTGEPADSFEDLIDWVGEGADEAPVEVALDHAGGPSSAVKETMVDNREGETSHDLGSRKVIFQSEDEKTKVWGSDDAAVRKDVEIETDVSAGTIQVDEDFDISEIDSLLSKHKGAHKSAAITQGKKKPVKRKPVKKAKGSIDYDLVLAEANKLQLIDMRNQAYFEIVDYAVDRGHIGKAADIIEGISTPELRDSARAKIGVGLAKRGNAEAAFAVLDEIEIAELTAPIRLEIIAALTATRAERAAPQRLR